MNAAFAKAMIADHGQVVSLTYHAPGAYDLATNTVALADAQVATVGVVLPISRGLKNMPGSTIQADAQQLLLPGDVEQPTPGTTVTIGNLSYTITEVAPLAPAGDALIYDCIIGGPTEAPPLPVPLAVSDFANGVYSIGGVARTVDDLWVENTAYDGCHWNPATDIVAGVGVVVPGSTLRGPTATDTLKHAVLQAIGFTAVIECTVPTGAGMYFEWTKLPAYNIDLFYSDGDAGLLLDDGVYPQSDMLPPLATAKKVGVTFGASAYLVQNGSAPVTIDPGNDLTQLSDIGFSGLGGLTVRKISFYPMQDAAALKRLTA